MWGAVAVLLGGFIKVFVNLEDDQAQATTESLGNLLVIFGPLVIAYGRTRLQQKLNTAHQAVQSSPAPTAVEATPAPPRVGT